MFIENEGKLVLVPFNGERTSNKLEAGVYNMKVERSFMGELYLFEETDIYNNTNIISEGVFKRATNHIENFFSEANDIVHREMGITKKSAVFYSGFPGTGKTFLAGQLAKRMADKYNAVGIICNDTISNIGEVIDKIRMNDKGRNIVLIIDEFDKTYDSDDMRRMLPFLDGKDSKENLYIIFTMNKDGHVPSVLKERVGRIEEIFKFKPNEKSVLKIMISNVTPKNYKEKIDAGKIANDILMDEGVDHITIDLVKLRIKDLLRSIVEEELKKQRAESLKDSEEETIISMTVAQKN